MQTIHHQQPPPLPSPSPHHGHQNTGQGHHSSGPGSQGPPSTSSTPAPRANSATPFVPPGDGLFCPECKNPFANKYSLMKHLRSTRCRQESEATINRIINDQLTCSRCYKQFGSIQALGKHVEGNCIFSEKDSRYKQIQNLIGQRGSEYRAPEIWIHWLQEVLVFSLQTFFCRFGPVVLC